MYVEQDGFKGNISKNGPAVTRNVTDSKNATGYRTSSNNSFNATIPYSDSEGYSGNLSKSGSSYVISGLPPDSKHIRWGGTYWTNYDFGYYKGYSIGNNNGWIRYYTYGAPGKVYYRNKNGRTIIEGPGSNIIWYYVESERRRVNNENTTERLYADLGPADGYSGTLSQVSYAGGYNSWRYAGYSDGYLAKNTWAWYKTCPVTCYYEGDVYRPDTRVWRQNYSGTVSRTRTVYDQKYAGNISKTVLDHYESVPTEWRAEVVYEGYINYPTSISVTPNPVELRVGETTGLTVTANFSDGTNEPVVADNCTVGDESIVHAGPFQGWIRVYGVKPGATTIMVTYQGKSKTVPVTVKGSVISLEVSPDPVNIRVGETIGLTTMAQLSDGTEEDVTGEVVYTLGDESIARLVPFQGIRILGVSPGTTTITVTYGGKSKTVPVTVKAEVKKITVISEKGNILRKGGTSQLTVIAEMSGKTTRIVTNEAAYNSSNPSAATVSATGLVTGVNKGVTTITAEYEGKTDTINIEVRPRLNLYIRTLQ